VTLHRAPTALPDVRRPQQSSYGPEGDELLGEVQAAVGTLAQLLTHAERLGEPVVTAIRVGREDVQARLAREELRVVLVGEPGSGKSTFIDALLGEQLLGKTSTPPHVLSTVRRGAERRYRARVADGAVVEFVQRASESSTELERSLGELEARRAEAHEAREAARADLSALQWDADQAEQALGKAFRAFEQSRLQADALGTELQQIERDAETTELTLARSEGELPRVLYTEPAWWAVWLWLARLSLLLFMRASHRTHQSLVEARTLAEADRSRVRAATSEAAEACQRLEGALEAANAPVEQARTRVQVARQSTTEAERQASELEAECERQKLEIVRRVEAKRQRFQSELAQVLGASVPGNVLLELEIDHPAQLLPEGVTLIDVPFGFAENAVAEERAWKKIREQADACILVSELERAVSGKTKGVLQQLREIVVHVILVLSKLDQAVHEAERRGTSDPAASVEQARRIGTRRFAREVGRDPNEVLSIAVSAQDALLGGKDPQSRLQVDTDKLFVLLRRERALILGSRSASIVRRCIAEASEAEQRAEQAYLERIATLEAGRRPEPEQLRAELLRTAEPRLQAAASRVQASGAGVVRDGIRVLGAECAALIDDASNPKELAAIVPRVAQAIGIGLSRIRDEAREQLTKQADREVSEIEVDAYGTLRERYDLIHEVTRAPGVQLSLAAIASAPEAPSGDLAREIAEKVRAASRRRLGVGLAGAISGAALGTLIRPGWGTAAGALLGLLTNFGVRFGALKRACNASVAQTISSLEQAFAAQIADTTPALTIAMRRLLDESLEQALARFSRWIAEPLAAERAAIVAERDKLADLHALVSQLELHDDRLESLGKAAVDASLGLCR
jgi:GTP-binding protein EngB required for normal cell division